VEDIFPKKRKKIVKFTVKKPKKKIPIFGSNNDPPKKSWKEKSVLVIIGGNKQNSSVHASRISHPKCMYSYGTCPSIHPSIHPLIVGTH
jgi:hypothetical protein